MLRLDKLQLDTGLFDDVAVEPGESKIRNLHQNRGETIVKL